MARITKKQQAETATTAKVARVRKGKAASGQQAKAKASGQQAATARKGKATTASGQQALRGQYANKRITITAEGKAANPRGLRGDRWAIVSKAKNTSDFLGKPYTGHDGVERPFTAAKFANFVERGFVELTD